MKTIRLGKVANLELSAKPSALTGFALMWVLLSIVAIALLKLPLGEAIAGGLAATLSHWLSEIIHQAGHAWVARRTGYPMKGIRFFGVLSTSLYPQDEPELAANIHVQRALGGPTASLTVVLLASITVWLLMPQGTLFWWIGLFVCVENLLIFTLGAFLPLGFTDGSTLLHWWRRERAKNKDAERLP